MSEQRMDADTAETLAGVVRLLHRAAELVWAAVDLSMVASIEIAYVVRDTAADHPCLTAPARIIGMRTQGEAGIAIEQGETRYEGVIWTTPPSRFLNLSSLASWLTGQVRSCSTLKSSPKAL